jgi:hypothetical protein
MGAAAGALPSISSVELPSILDGHRKRRQKSTATVGRADRTRIQKEIAGK